MNKILLISCFILLGGEVGMPSLFANRLTYKEVEDSWDQQIKDAKEIAREAGKRILEVREKGRLMGQDVVLQNKKRVRQTNADVEAGRYIIEELSKKYPTYGLISQDQMDQDPYWYMKDYIWLINPIDGTKEFERGGEDFHVQIGLLVGDQSVVGVSYYPATGTYVWAVKGEGAWIEKDADKQRLLALPCSDKTLVRSSSDSIIQSHLQRSEWVAARVVEAQSSTSRLLKVIQGQASLYVSLGASPEGIEKKGGVWNFGANAVIASEAGLILRTLEGNPLDLRQPKALLPEGVVVTSDPETYAQVLWADWQLKR